MEMKARPAEKQGELNYKFKLKILLNLFLKYLNYKTNKFFKRSA